MQFETMTYEADGRIGRLTLNRPEVLNAANLQWVLDLNAAAEAIARDAAVRVVVITGAGRAFCSGIDLKALSANQTDFSFFDRWERALRRFETMEKLVIAGMHGYAIGGGLQLALASDIRVAAEGTKLGLTAVKECLIPGLGTHRLARFIGLGRAKRLILMGDLIDAQEAHAMGLIDFLVPAPDFRQRLDEIAGKLLRSASQAARLSKLLTNRAFDAGHEEFLEEYLKAQQTALESGDHQEAMRAYREKRDPVF